MFSLPKTTESLVLRTDFSDDRAWEMVCAAIRAPVGEFRAYVECISDPQYDGLNAEQLVSLAQNGDDRSFLFVVDRAALLTLDHPILVVDLSEEPGRTFRVIPTAAWSVENNLSLANMGFDEFADNSDADGVFRGFPEG